MTDKFKKTFEDYAGLNISFEQFEHAVQSFLTISKSRNEDSNTVTIEYVQGAIRPKFEVEVSTSTIVRVLEEYLANRVSLKELENWANMLLMDDDHFKIGRNEPDNRRNPAIDLMHQIASWPDKQSRQIIEACIAQIKESPLIDASLRKTIYRTNLKFWIRGIGVVFFCLGVTFLPGSHVNPGTKDSFFETVNNLGAFLIPATGAFFLIGIAVIAISFVIKEK